MTKQAQAEPEERPTTELLLRRFRLADEFVDSIKKANIEAGLDKKYMDYFIDWRELAEEIKYKRWLENVTNKRTGRFSLSQTRRVRTTIRCIHTGSWIRS